MRGWSRLVVLFACLVALAMGCGGDEHPAAETHATTTHTSGGETPQHQSTTSSQNADDLNPAGGGGGPQVPAGDAADAGVASGQLGAPPDGGPSLWDQQEADTTPQLPPRRPMNGSARGPYHDGFTAAAANNVAAATSAFQQALSADPGAFKAAYALGVLADRAGQTDRAMQFYRQALRIQPDYERAADAMIAIYLRRGDVPGALAFIQPIAQQWQRNLWLQASYADVLVHAGRFDEAVTAARAALHRDERSVPPMLSIVKACLARQPPRTELARSVLDQALAVDTNNAEAHYLNGEMYKTDNRLADAINEFSRATTLRPDYPEAQSELGAVYLSGGNYDQAVAAFQKVTQLLPDQVAGWLDLAEAYRSARSWQLAKTTYDRAIAMQSVLPEAHFGLGLMYMAAQETFPGLDKLTALQRATQEFNTYRDQKGPQLPHDDASQTYLADCAKQIDREQKRLAREALRAQREADHAAHQAAAAAAHPDGGAAPAPAPPTTGAGADGGAGAH